MIIHQTRCDAILRERESGGNSGFKSDSKSATKEVSPSKVESSRASNSRSSDIVCFKCGGRGHKKFECPNERRVLLTEEGYMSASDGEKNADPSSEKSEDRE